MTARYRLSAPEGRFVARNLPDAVDAGIEIRHPHLDRVRRRTLRLIFERTRRVRPGTGSKGRRHSRPWSHCDHLRARAHRWTSAGDHHREPSTSRRLAVRRMIDSLALVGTRNDVADRRGGGIVRSEVLRGA